MLIPASCGRSASRPRSCAPRGICGCWRSQTRRGPIQTLHTTDEHPFWSVDRREFLPAGDLNPGEGLLSLDGHLLSVHAGRIEHHPHGIAVYNFRVAHDHTYFAAASPASAPSSSTTPTTAPTRPPPIPTATARRRMLGLRRETSLLISLMRRLASTSSKGMPKVVVIARDWGNRGKAECH
ncbi:MAG: HINT domain-containing protein [Pirellulales bacterium]|nr:HINT domain-containing protein [Pirellulales bacterium]